MSKRNPPLTSPGKRLSFNLQDMHILVVDDEKVSRLVIQRLLERAGYTRVPSLLHVA